MYSKLENSGIRVAVGDCSVTERRRRRPPYQTGKTVHMHANTLQTRRGRTHGAGCVRPWFHTAEPLGERRHENWITHISQLSDNSLPPLFPGKKAIGRTTISGLSASYKEKAMQSTYCRFSLG